MSTELTVQSNQVAPSADMGKRIGQYLQLRDKIKEIEADQAEVLKPYRQALDQLGNHMLEFLNTTGQDNAAVRGVGTIYKSTKRSVTVADAAAFQRFVIGGGLWDLVDMRANVKGVEEFLEEEKQLPPGLNTTTRMTIGVRKA